MLSFYTLITTISSNKIVLSNFCKKWGLQRPHFASTGLCRLYTLQQQASIHNLNVALFIEFKRQISWLRHFYLTKLFSYLQDYF